jgi:hypothetical protein
MRHPAAGRPRSRGRRPPGNPGRGRRNPVCFGSRRHRVRLAGPGRRWACSAVGSAPPRQGGGPGFDSPQVHGVFAVPGVERSPRPSGRVAPAAAGSAADTFPSPSSSEGRSARLKPGRFSVRSGGRVRAAGSAIGRPPGSQPGKTGSTPVLATHAVGVSTVACHSSKHCVPQVGPRLRSARTQRGRGQLDEARRLRAEIENVTSGARTAISAKPPSRGLDACGCSPTGRAPVFQTGMTGFESPQPLWGAEQGRANAAQRRAWLRPRPGRPDCSSPCQ